MTKTVMIVDDAIVIRQLITMTLARQGFDVIEAVDGTDALRKVNGKKIEMVITDLNMPQMDGIELIRQLRSRPDFRFTPIVMLTTESQQTKKEEGQKAGASGWILKPFNAKQLLEAVRKFVV